MIRIPTRTHGIMDLVAGAMLLAAPFVLKSLTRNNPEEEFLEDPYYGSNGYTNGNGIEGTLLPAMGASILAQGLMTDFELGAVKAVGMKSHLTMDIAMGAAMIAAPFILNLDDRLKVPMVAMGAAEIGMALLTQTEPAYRKTKNGKRTKSKNKEAYVEELADVF